jgi:hypothetical protein
MDASMVVKVAVAVAVLIFLDALFVELRSAAREAKRLVSRLGAYAELPIFSLLATSEHDGERLNVALEAIPPLLERAACALAVVRSLGRERPAPALAYLPKGTFPD